MKHKRHLLVVEDEPAIQAGLVDVFIYHGFDVTATADGHDGLAKATSGAYDLVILDVMLPGLNGFDVCEQIRATDRELPIVMLTAKVSDEDIVNGLRLGADDYVGKPFGVQELVLRVEAVLRRSYGASDDASVLKIDDGAVIDRDNLDGKIDGQSVQFTRCEVEILALLARCAGRPVSRDELLHQVWGYARDQDIETRTVDIHIAKLRRKIESDPSSPKRLVTIRGAGYKLIVEA